MPVHTPLSTALLPPQPMERAAERKVHSAQTPTETPRAPPTAAALQKAQQLEVVERTNPHTHLAPTVTPVPTYRATAQTLS
mmetsp:Transcript_46205/g.91083  ORF Transcript_46205/g.91083 Transcript_46205/m.91083 type:complete len:81 (+) Transcript_46205:1568-1810(+)